MLVHWIWYAMLPGISVRQKLMLLEHISSPEDIFHTENYGHIPEVNPDMAKALANKDISPAKAVVKSCAERKISILTFGDAAYPSRLRNVDDPPLVLYYKGVLPDFEGRPVIGVVGTRKASAYGLNNARQMAKQIASCGGLVVSGGAAGIDTMALQGAMEAGEQTVAVLGCGVDVVYPRSNKQMFTKIQEAGCLLSEYLPGTEPMPWQFPARNRIISGIANGVLVVEAPEKSGALITARCAFEQGREVFAVPGNIDVATCAGSNGLLQDCASAVLCGWDVMKEYAPYYPDTVKRQEASTRQNCVKVAQAPLLPTAGTDADKKDIDNPNIYAYSDLEIVLSRLSPEERQIVSALDTEPQPVDEVIARVGVPAGRVLSVLTKLALKGVVTNHPGRLVSVKKQ